MLKLVGRHIHKLSRLPFGAGDQDQKGAQKKIKIINTYNKLTDEESKLQF